MKEKYSAPEMEVILFATADILTASDPDETEIIVEPTPNP